MTRVTCLNRIQTKGIEPHRINLFTTKKESIEDSWSNRIPETRDHREKSKTPKLTEWRLDNERNGGDTQLKSLGEALRKYLFLTKANQNGNHQRFKEIRTSR